MTALVQWKMQGFAAEISGLNPCSCPSLVWLLQTESLGLPKIHMLKPNGQCFVLGGRVFVRCSGHEGRVLINEMSGLREEVSSPCCPVRLQWKDSLLWGSGLLSNASSASTLILNFPPSRTVRYEFLLFISHPVYAFCYGSPNGPLESL